MSEIKTTESVWPFIQFSVFKIVTIFFQSQNVSSITKRCPRRSQSTPRRLPLIRRTRTRIMLTRITLKSNTQSFLVTYKYFVVNEISSFLLLLPFCCETTLYAVVRRNLFVVRLLYKNIYLVSAATDSLNFSWHHNKHSLNTFVVFMRVI